MFEFSILSFASGWIDVKISNEAKSIEIYNSQYLSNDALKILLRNLNELAFNESGTKWLCWHGEPYAYIWKLDKLKDIIHYEIFEPENGSENLMYEGIELANEKVHEFLISGETSFLDMYRKIYSFFEEYSDGDKLKDYERKWAVFPSEEFQKAKATLG